MKPGFLILMGLSSFLVSTAQTKGDNQIIIKNTNLHELAQTLVENGFTFDKYDSSFSYLMTTPKPIEEEHTGKTFRYQFTIYVKNGDAYLTGVAELQTNGFHAKLRLQPIYYYTVFGHPDVDWIVLTETAKKLSPNYTTAKK
jgi:hypothetical protein